MNNKGIYIHIPFCVRKCLYCDFYSVTDTTLYDDYVKALIKEIEKNKGTEADSVFIGGGTPTVLSDRLFAIIDALKDSIKLTADCEFTVEANPGTVTEDLLKGLYTHGVNRLSIGAQSFNDNELKALGRIHTREDIFAAFNMARRAGFDNINLDIMLSTPFQTKESIKKTLEAIKQLGAEHISAYSLIIEEGTPFYDMELELPDEDDEREIYYYTVDFLYKMGLERYEISNFAKKGYESRHNIKYWTGKDYLGFGAAAHSYNGGVRYSNSADIGDYIKGIGYGIERVIIDPEEKLREKFLLGLRMSSGVRYEGEFADTIARLTKNGLVTLENSFLKLTTKGFDLANQVFMEFVD